MTASGPIGAYPPDCETDGLEAAPAVLLALFIELLRVSMTATNSLPLR